MLFKDWVTPTYKAYLPTLVLHDMSPLYSHVATRSTSHVAERRPRFRNGRSWIENQSGNSCMPALSTRKLARRYCAPPDTAQSRWPMSERSISFENSTGYSPVATCRGASRASARCEIGRAHV